MLARIEKGPLEFHINERATIYTENAKQEKDPKSLSINVPSFADMKIQAK